MAFTEETFTNERGQTVSKATVTADGTGAYGWLPLAAAKAIGAKMPNGPGTEYTGYAAALPGVDEYAMGTGRDVSRQKAYIHMYQGLNEDIDAIIAAFEEQVEKLLRLRKANAKAMSKLEKALAKERLR